MSGRVCFLSSVHPATDKRVHCKEAVSLRSANWRVLHICPGFKHDVRRLDGIAVISYRRRRGVMGRIAHLGAIVRLCLRVRPDVLHCNEVDSAFVGIILSRITKARVVFDIHEEYKSALDRSPVSKVLRVFLSACISPALKVVSRIADGVVLAKDGLEEGLSRKADNTVIVRNYVRVDAVNPSECGVEDARTQTTRLEIAYFGTFARHRGWPVVLEALQQVIDVDCRFNLIGGFSDGTEKEFEIAAAEMGVSGWVMNHGWCDYAEGMRRLARCDLGLILLDRTLRNHVLASPHKLYDYMAAGLAVVVPEYAVEPAAVVRAARCGFVIDTGSPAALAEVFRTVSDDIALLRRMGARGSSAVRRDYSWDTQGAKLVAFYEVWRA